MCSVNLSNAEILGLIKKIKGNDWKLISYNINTLSDNPMGFLGNHFGLRIETLNIITGNEEILKFFIKTTPNINAHAQYVDEIGAFKKEVFLQRDVLPKLLEISSNLTLPWAPICHIAKDDLLLFDDLSVKDYKMAEGREILDFEHCVSALKTLADFHTASLIWEENNKKLNDKSYYLISDLYPKVIEEVCYVKQDGHARNKWLKSVTNATAHICRLIGRDKEVENIHKIVQNAIALIGPSDECRNVLSHADLWANNFMFKYNNDGFIQHCVLVDYQLSRYAPPALDLTCCIHLISTLELRSNHMGYFVNVYYERLTNVLKAAGIDASKIIPRKEIVEGCDKYKIIGLLETIFFGTTIWIPSKLSATFYSDANKCVDVLIGNRNDLVEEAFNTDPFFKKQMTELVGELLDLCSAS